MIMHGRRPYNTHTHTHTHTSEAVHGQHVTEAQPGQSAALAHRAGAVHRHVELVVAVLLALGPAVEGGV